MHSKQFLNGKKCCVLAVDDDDMVLTLISRFLKRVGCEVFTCSNAAQALACLESHSFNVVLLDIRMPDMTGLELFSIIRKRWPEMAERAGFVTGDAPSEETRKFLRQTNRPILLKPFSIEELESFARNLAECSGTNE